MSASNRKPTRDRSRQSIRCETLQQIIHCLSNVRDEKLSLPLATVSNCITTTIVIFYGCKIFPSFVCKNLHLGQERYLTDRNTGPGLPDATLRPCGCRGKSLRQERLRGRVYLSLEPAEQIQEIRLIIVLTCQTGLVESHIFIVLKRLLLSGSKSCIGHRVIVGDLEKDAHYSPSRTRSLNVSRVRGTERLRLRGS